MSFDSIEKSVDQGQPRTYFEFIYGDGRGDVFRYVGSTAVLITGNVAPVIALNRHWTPRAMKHGEITNSGSLDKATLEITTGKDIELASLYIIAPPSRQVQLIIYRGNVGSSDYRRIWSGRVLNAAFEGAEIKFSCEPVSTGLRRIGLRRNYQYGCPHVLYGEACGLSRQANSAVGTIAATLNGLVATFQKNFRSLVLTAPEVIGGVLKIVLPDGREVRRSIVSATQEGEMITVKLMAVAPELAVGLPATLSRGCAHNWEACKAFGNTPNYGGCPNIPTKNPFSSNSF